MSRALTAKMQEIRLVKSTDGSASETTSYHFQVTEGEAKREIGARQIVVSMPHRVLHPITKQPYVLTNQQLETIAKLHISDFLRDHPRFCSQGRADELEFKLTIGAHEFRLLAFSVLRQPSTRVSRKTKARKR